MSQISTFKRVCQYLAPFKWIILAGMLCMGLIAPVGLLPAWIVGEFTDVVAGEKEGSISFFVLAMLGILILEAILGMARSLLMHIAGQKFVLKIRKDAYEAAQGLSFSFFDRTKTGDTMSRLSSDVDAIENVLVHGTDAIIVNTLRVVLISGALINLDWRIALAVAAPAPIIAVSVYLFGNKIRKYSRLVRDQLGILNGKLQENIVGIRVIKSFAAEKREYGTISEHSEEYANRSIRLVWMWATFYPGIELLAGSGFVSTLWVGASLIDQGQLSVGDMVKTFGWLMMFYGPIHSLSRINETIQRALAAGDRVFELMHSEADVIDKPDAIELDPVRGKVELREASLRYDDGADVLHRISLIAEPGECVALVGPSGAGKTSIINLIPRFYDPAEGMVLVDDHDVRDIAKGCLRTNVAMVLQETFLFDATIAENIAYARPDASLDEVREAARAANADVFIDSFDDGYDTIVGERGVRLSGGQKQRVSIARAILADPRILVLDEATSAVDTEAEVLIHQALDNLIQGRTTFIIAHRLSTVRNADKIVVLDGGRVAEQGKHDELMANGGLYSRMCDLQFSLSDAG